MKNKIFSKLKNSSGETIAEVLIAALVIALAMLLLVSMLMASQRMIQKSKEVFGANMTVRNQIESESGTVGVTLTLKLNGNLKSVGSGNALEFKYITPESGSVLELQVSGIQATKDEKTYLFKYNPKGTDSGSGSGSSGEGDASGGSGSTEGTSQTGDNG